MIYSLGKTESSWGTLETGMEAEHNMGYLGYFKPTTY